MITDTSVEQFLTELASGAPTPGGGSAAAIIGAMGAALISMVCNVTLGKKDCESVAAEMHTVLDRSEELRQRLTALVAEDVAAFGALMASYRFTKATEEEKAQRSLAIQSALRAATVAPLECARACAAVIVLSRRAAQHGFSGVISDAGVGVLAAITGLRSAALNVQINAPLLQDREFAAQSIAELDVLLSAGARDSEEIFDLVRARV